MALMLTVGRAFHQCRSARSVHAASALTQQRKKQPLPLSEPRELVVACPEMQSGVNLSRLVRACGCFGVSRVLYAGSRTRLHTEITRGAEEAITLDCCRSLLHPLKRFKADGYRVVGLEQTVSSASLFSFTFPRRCVILIGHERKGVDDELLAICDAVVEIPTYGLPHSHNASSAGLLAVYEYCRQHTGMHTGMHTAGSREQL